MEKQMVTVDGQFFSPQTGKKMPNTWRKSLKMCSKVTNYRISAHWQRICIILIQQINGRLLSHYI